MRTSDFSYELPAECIAQTPVEPRDHSRLLVMGRGSGVVDHRRFDDLPDYLNKGDVLVLNNTRVIPARLVGRKVGGQAVVEILLLHSTSPGIWKALAKPGKRLRVGTEIEFSPFDGEDQSYPVRAEIISKSDEGTVSVRLSDETLLGSVGKVPLPPYIFTSLQDPERYQTVYAESNGSTAAPTAGLHFTPALLEAIRGKGIELVHVTLHVGLGSFRPVKVECPEDHDMHYEYCVLAEDQAARLRDARAEGRRIICVGTSAARAIEGVAAENGGIGPFEGWIGLYILPGHNFRMADGLVTNFHMPRSTLLMLVSAFAGKGPVLAAYQEALKSDYRFLSFGDAMLIL